MKFGANRNAYTNVVTITWPLNEKLRLGDRVPAIKSFGVSNNPLFQHVKVVYKIIYIKSKTNIQNSSSSCISER